MQSAKLPTLLIGTVIMSLILLASTLIPYTSTVIQEWKVQVTDINDQPVANAEVTQSVLFSGRRENWCESKKTDEQGRTMFSARTIRASFSERLLGRIRMYRAHYPYGASALASVCFKGHSAASKASRTSGDSTGSDSAGTIHLKLGRETCGLPDW